eukprot:5082518-Pleurochrysis_carterae.AAC.1
MKTLATEDIDAVDQKCKAVRFFGRPRVSPKIFESEDHFLILLWNKKFGLTFKTFSAFSMSDAFLDMKDEEPTDDVANALFGESVHLE